jgi:WD40 repeat protein
MFILRNMISVAIGHRGVFVNITSMMSLLVSVAFFFTCGAMNQNPEAYDSELVFGRKIVEGDKPVRSYCFHPKGGRILVGFADRTVSLIDLQTGKRRGWIGEMNLLSISSDGVSVGGVSDDGVVTIRDLGTGNIKLFFGLNVYYNYKFCFSPCGIIPVPSLKCLPTALLLRNKDIVVGDASGSVRVWDSETGNCPEGFVKKNGSPIEILWESFFSPECFWGKSGELIYKFLLKDKMVGEIAASEPFCVAKDSSYFVMLWKKETSLNCVETRLLLYNSSINRIAKEYSIGNYRFSSICLVGKFVALGTIDGNVLVFDLVTAKILAVYWGTCKHPIRRLEISADGGNIAFFVKDKLTVLDFYELSQTNKWVLELNTKYETKQQLVLPSISSWWKE